MAYNEKRDYQSFRSRLRKLSKLILEGDLVNASNGGTFDVALGTLPAGAVIPIPPGVKLDTQFTGGAASAVGMTIGTAAAPTLVMTSFDVFGATASGLFVRGTQGAQQQVPTGGQSIIARFTPDGAHNLTALTAGSVTIELYYCIPDLGS